MKRFLCLFFGLALIFISACSQRENAEVELMDFIYDTTPVMGEAQRSARFTTEFSSEFTFDGSEITTSEGLTYGVSNGTVSEKGISSEGGLVIDFKGSLVTEFNRYRLYYVSDQALKCVVKYTVNGAVVEDTVFLEAGTDIFTCLILGFLENEKAVSLNELVVNSCNGEPFNFLLCNVFTDEYGVPQSSDYIIEGERYKLGVRLIWGGGINLIVDNYGDVDGIENLINQYDTGRLVQQSYYGSDEDSRYDNATFTNDSSWPYNPVQGGDKYMNHSRLIDFVETENSIYIKSQPQDWALDGMITSSYMENIYTVYDVCIRVENRFVDFTCWSHPAKDQELPAFYTVSYLDTFTYYNGMKPWMEDDLFVESDLEFWGDSKYAADCRFKIADGNTETWCAWYNRKDDYGIGIYVPNIDMFYAGRYGYDGSKDSDASSTNYVAPLNFMQIVSFEPIEYEYLITTGSISNIRDVFTANKDFTDNGSFKKH